MIHITRTEKEKFISQFSEEDFRDRVVRRLFRALKFRDGRDTCGPEEFGKDAIFVETDKFGDENIIAVQTKKGNVNLSGDPSSNLHELCTQVRTALTQPHVCTRTKRKILPQAVYVVASGKINQAARNYIAEQVQDPRTKFLDRDDLISKIDETCPELWAGIVSDVSPYLKALANRVDELSIDADANPVLSSIGVYAAASDTRFVDVRLGYHSPKVVKRSGQIHETLDYEEKSGTALLSGSSVRALLLGDAGAGKTTLLVRLAYLIAKQAISAVDKYRVPIFVRSHQLVGASSEGIYSVLEDIVMKIHDLSSSPFTVDDLEDGRIVLLIDGLDELSNSSNRQEVVDFAERFVEEYPRCSIAIAARPYSSIDKLSGISKFKRYRISPLSMKDAEKMLLGTDVRGKELEVEWKREILRRLDGVHGIELNPLLVTVFAVSSGFEKRDVPANITELFAKFTELMLGRWDEKKGLAQQYQAKVKEHLISAFAFKLQSAGESRFTRSEFTEFASGMLCEMNLAADLHTVVTEIVDRSGLLRGDEELEFKHLLLQEYFAAKGVPSLSWIKSVINKEWWRNSVVFYFGAQPDAVNELLEVATDDCTQAEESYLTVGLALQACYLSKLDDRVEVWKWVVEAAAIASKREIDNPDENYPISVFLGRYLESRDAVALTGVEKEATGAEEWALNGNHTNATMELRRFWYAVTLVELAKFKKLEAILRARPFDNHLLSTALHIGCFFASSVRAISQDSKDAADSVCRLLEPRVAFLRNQVTKEFRGQLLEYRSGGVVALDLEDPTEIRDIGQ